VRITKRNANTNEFLDISFTLQSHYMMMKFRTHVCDDFVILRLDVNPLIIYMRGHGF